MPKLSPTMEEGQISRWLKNEGDEIEANETIAEVDTDKATMEMTSLEAGTLLKIIVPGGENAKLGQTIGILGKKGEDFSALLDEATASSNGNKSEPPAVAGGSKAEESAPKDTPKAEAKPEPKEETKDQKPKTEDQPSNGRMIVSPIAARMAAENGIDLKALKGSGPGGRIIKRDIEEAMAGGGKIEVVGEIEETKAAPSFSASSVQGASAYREENTSKMRQVIASRLTESIGPIPTFYLTVEIEMDAALEFRKQINASIPEADKVSVNDIIVKVTAQALTKHAWANASYQDKTIRFYEDADIGVAVAIEDGLITPVIRAANRKGIVEISKEIKEKAVRAREKKLQPEEYTGATFSISNLGMFGIKEFTAIINPPEAGIFAIGAATPTPVVRNGEIVVRNIMNVTMSCDHRVIDGATGAKFLQTFKQMLENPILMLM
ncbi:MAG TPA: pyruvate dehydrogenase complex dihydrolipoamide acetyltransferase [Pyrinomonadaceae bacterium]|nr:pyruvate dehydrogenase complex dihydrolipoamide acetyltransferase [Pyrinomonadaceae bacterium]